MFAFAFALLGLRYGERYCIAGNYRFAYEAVRT